MIPTVPPPIEGLVNTSVERFEKTLKRELGILATAGMLHKWTELYREEVKLVAIACYRAGNRQEEEYRQ